MTNRAYDTLKYISLVILPAIGTLYFAIAQIWGLPYAEEIVGTITAVDAFLGAIVKSASDGYTDEMTEEEAELFEDEILEDE